MRSGVEPRISFVQDTYIEAFLIEIKLIDGCYLKLTPCRGLYAHRFLHNIVWVEVETYYSIVGAWLRRLLNNREAFAAGIEFHYSVSLRIIYPVAEHGGLFLGRCSFECLAENVGKSGSVKDVVAEHKADIIITDEFPADDECLSQPLGPGLLGIAERHAEACAVAKQPPEHRQILWCGDDQYFPDSCFHEHGNGIIDHWLVVNGEKLLAYPFCYRIKPGARSSGEYNSFHLGFGEKLLFFVIQQR